MIFDKQNMFNVMEPVAFYIGGELYECTLYSSGGIKEYCKYFNYWLSLITMSQKSPSRAYLP